MCLLTILFFPPMIEAWLQRNIPIYCKENKIKPPYKWSLIPSLVLERLEGIVRIVAHWWAHTLSEKPVITHRVQVYYIEVLCFPRKLDSRFFGGRGEREWGGRRGGS